MQPYIPPCWASLHTRPHISCTRVHDMGDGDCLLNGQGVPLSIMVLDIACAMGKQVYTLECSISNLYHIETVNYDSILCNVFCTLCKFCAVHNKSM